MSLGTFEPNEFERVHFIGIGGAGMSGIARVMAERGYQVSGSDLKQSKYTKTLEFHNIKVFIGHDTEHIKEVDPQVVVISTAIPEKNPELVYARKQGIAVWQRAKALAYLARDSYTFAFAGTHGKTTSSSMAATTLDRMGLKPSFLIGGIVDGYDTNGVNGNKEYFVCEADESDGSFLHLDPNIVVVSNIEADHLDHYGSFEELVETFKKFMASVDDSGAIIVNADQPEVLALAKSTAKRVVSFGFSDDADARITLGEKDPKNLLAQHFSLSLDGQEYPCALKASPGIHNVLNAASVLSACYAAGLDVEAAAKALSEFSGVRRRFDYVGEVNGATIIDDYGHHPTEIAATLKAAQGLNYNKIHVIFQPHRYTRTQNLADEFTEAFGYADEVLLLDIFAAGETPIPGITSKNLARLINQKHPDTHASYIPDWQDMIAHILESAKPHDLIITMGAGDITSLGPDIIEARTRKHGA